MLLVCLYRFKIEQPDSRPILRYVSEPVSEAGKPPRVHYTLYPAENDIFDYESRQTEFVQLIITDNGNHRATEQLVINIEDVNDEPPRLFLVSIECIL